MKNSAKAEAARQVAYEVPKVVQKLVAKRYLTEAVVAAWQNQKDANVVKKLVEDLDCMAFHILPANFADAEREEICTDLTAKALETLGAGPVGDPIKEAGSPANDPPAAVETETPPSTTSGAPDPVATDAAPPAPPEPATEQDSSEAAMVPAMPAMPITTGDVEAEFAAECSDLARKVIAHEVAYALGWYPLADALKAMRDRYDGRVQDLALRIANHLDRSRRWVFNLLQIAEHPPELRARAHQVGLHADQGRLRQLDGLTSDDTDRALQAFATGGPKAMDAVVRGTPGLHERAERDPVFASMLADFRDPSHAFGTIAATSPSTSLPKDLTSRYPALTGLTFGDVLAAADKPTKNRGDEKAGWSGKTKATKPKRFVDGFDLLVAEERDVNLRAARIALVITKVVDGNGTVVENAVVTVMVCDRTV